VIEPAPQQLEPGRVLQREPIAEVSTSKSPLHFLAGALFAIYFAYYAMAIFEAEP
jgi:hypothetical protein